MQKCAAVTFLPAMVVTAVLTLGLAPASAHGQVCGGMQPIDTFGGPTSRAVAVSANGVVVGNALTFTNQSRAFRRNQSGALQNLGTLGGNFSEAIAVSSDGTVVAGNALHTNGELRVFRWTAASGMQDIGTLGGVSTAAKGISADGSVIVGQSFNPSSNGRAFRWTAAGGIQDLGTLAGHSFAQARFVSADGSVVVGISYPTASTANLFRTFRWTVADGMQELGTPSDTQFQAQAISADGSAVVGNAGANGLEAYRWKAATGFLSLGGLGGAGSNASSVSADGSVVVGNATTPSQVVPFRWTQSSGMQSLGIPVGGNVAGARLVSPDGATVAGIYTLPGFVDRVFRWTQTEGLRDIGSLGTTLTRVFAMTPDGGTIVGYSTDTLGRDRGFVWGGDKDGDGLYDDWECNGIPYIDASGTPLRYILDGDGDGTSDADWQHKDLFVEVDAMNGLFLSDTAAGNVIDAFAASPLTNPDGVPGITLHIMKDELNLPRVPVWTTDGCWPLDFDTFRQDWYGTPGEHDNIPRLEARAKAFRYCIVADQASAENVGGCGQMPGDNFVVFFNNNTYTDLSQASVFMHELGHNLGLGHGGGDAINGKPNYPSIMNYVLTYKSAWNEEFWRLDFSRANSSPSTTMRDLNEAALNELVGIGVADGLYSNYRMPYGVTIDPDDGPPVRAFFYVRLDGSQEDFGSPTNDNQPDSLFSASVIQDLNYVTADPAAVLPTEVSPGQVLHSFNDWERVRMGLPLAATLGAGAPAPAYPTDELTVEARAWIDANFPIPPRLCDSIDFNNDGVFPDSADIDDFLAVFAGGACSNDPNCGDLDFNNDGVFPDSGDIEAFLRVFAGGVC